LVCDLPSVPIAAGVRWREFKHKGAALAPSVDYLCVACRYFVDRSVQKQIFSLDSGNRANQAKKREVVHATPRIEEEVLRGVRNLQSPSADVHVIVPEEGRTR
jgi:hypothetical protein